MSQVTLLVPASFPPGSVVQTITGNTGGSIGPDGTDNINIVGSGSVTVTGDPGTNTLTISDSGGSSGITTIDGDSGSVTGSTISIIAGTASNLQGATVSFTATSGTTLNLKLADTNGNMTVGALSGNATMSSTGASSNISFGSNNLQRITSGEDNYMFGGIGGNHITTGSFNIGIGFQALGSTLRGVTTGANNIGIGFQPGHNYQSSETGNFIVSLGSDPSILGESNTLHIGNGTGTGTGQLNAAFIAGIQGINVGSVASVVSIAASGDQLGTTTLTAGSGITITPGANSITIAASGGGGGITTINGDSGSVTGSTVTITGGTSGAVFSGSGSTMTESFNYLSLPTTTSTNGQITINSIPFLHGYGSNNVFVGPNAGNFTFNTTNGIFNTALGNNALSGLTSASDGSFNTAIGGDNLSGCTTGFNNSSFGFITMNSLTTGSENIGFGFNALRFLLSGTNNIAIGTGAGNNLTSSESSNIYLANAGVISENNTMRLGTTGTGTGEVSTTYIAAINGVTVTGAAVLVSSSDQLGIAVSSARFKENIEDMGSASDSILKLRPVSFNYKIGEDRSTQTGLIAEEVAETIPSLVVYDKEGLPQTVKYHELPVLLLNELQKALKRIEVLEEKLGAQ